MINKVFGNLTVTGYNGNYYYQCKCICGSVINVRKEKLINNIKTNCGCIRKLEYASKWVGFRVGKLVVTEIFDGRKALCHCDCGNDTIVYTNNLTRKNTTSCGCVHKSIAGIRHGLQKKFISEYRSWAMMKNRCLNPNCWSRKYYKDIHICDRWIDSFKLFFEDMGEKPLPKNKYSIDRIDNLKGYYSENCKWSNDTEQSRNRRKKVIFQD